MSSIDVHTHGKAHVWVAGSGDYSTLHICDDYTTEVFRVLVSNMTPAQAVAGLLSAFTKIGVPDMTMDGKSLGYETPMGGVRVNTTPSGGNFVPTVMPSGASWIDMGTGFTLFTSGLSAVRLHLGGMPKQLEEEKN